jgi:membrane protease YdiL (CAAX protease family)
MIISILISAILQVIVFTLLPFLFYLITHRTYRGFLNDIGMYKTDIIAIMQACIASIILVGLGILMIFISPDFKNLSTGRGTVPNSIIAVKGGINKMAILIILAFIKTALAEEILFRGFITKKLIRRLDFNIGNLIQACLFGLVHVLLFLNIHGINSLFLIFSFSISGLGGYLAGYFNEKKGKGSIISGWLMHGFANLISYILFVFIF